jgi:hypothetical protein
MRSNYRKPDLRERLGVPRVLNDMPVMAQDYIFDPKPDTYVVGRLRKNFTHNRWEVIVVCSSDKFRFHQGFYKSRVTSWRKIRLISEEEFEKYALLGGV